MRNLYEVTGQITDINTLLINKSEYEVQKSSAELMIQQLQAAYAKLQSENMVLKHQYTKKLKPTAILVTHTLSSGRVNTNFVSYEDNKRTLEITDTDLKTEILYSLLEI